MIVHDDYAIVEFGNLDQFQVYIRPKPEGLANAVASRILTLSSSTEGLMTYRAEYETFDTRLFLYVIHNQVGT
jgi:hypothetical protein